MAADPQFGAIPVVGSAVLSSSADTSYTAPTHAVTLLNASGPRQFTDGVTNTTTTVTSAAGASFATMGDIGRPISGAGIPAGTVVQAVASATSVTISQPATASASSLTLTLGGNIGTKVDEIDWVGTGTTVAGKITIFLYDGTTYHLVDELVVTAGSGSTTVLNGETFTKFVNLWIPWGWSLVAASTVASQLVNVTAYGENF